MDGRPPFLMVFLCALYWRIPRLVPYAIRLAKWGLAIVIALMMPYTVYFTVRGYAHWSPHLPGWLLPMMAVAAGAGTFLLFAWGAVVLFIDARRRP
jgi:cytochrome c oxidase subunit IV